jgi:hypothetical protein
LKILIDLPDEGARNQMFRQYLPLNVFDEHGQLLCENIDYSQLAKRSAGMQLLDNVDCFISCKITELTY